jgi:hypothetical protein
VTDTTYMTYSEMVDMSTIDKYVTALYWSLSTMSTVGYGDVAPKTMWE